MLENEICLKIEDIFNAVKDSAPLVPAMTNSVTMNFVADAQLAVGASATMVNLPDEGEMMANCGAAFYFNIGTVSTELVGTLPRTVRLLKQARKKWVFDPVGIGMGSLRTDILMLIREIPPQIIRSNASEIIALANLWGLDNSKTVDRTKGVDSVATTDSARKAAIAVAEHINGVVAVSGDIDLITDGRTIFRLGGGSPLMTRISGSGCALGGVIAAYAAVAEMPLLAALTGSMAFKAAGARAALNAAGPASFKIAFLDALYNLTAGEILSVPLKMEEI